MPQLLSGHTMTPAGILRPVSMQLSLQVDGQSTASITLDSESPNVPIGAWVQIWAPNGEMCVMYVKNRRKDYITGNIVLSLEHTFNLLGGMVVFGEVGPDTMSGTTGATTCSVSDAIDYLLGCQTENLWTCDQCDFNDAQGWKFTNSDIFSDLNSLTDAILDCQWEFDQTALPWKLRLKAWPTGDGTMEMRRNRNLDTLQITYDRSGMYTRVYPTGKSNLHIDNVNNGVSYLDNNTGTYGVIANVITDSSIGDADLLKAWAQKQLNKNSVPRVSVSISGYELSQATGESLDKFVIGRLCRIPLPEYGETVTERLSELSWRDCIAQPEAVTVTLANELKTITGVLNEKARGGGGGSKKANTAHDVQQEEFENADIWINRDSVWAVCGSYTVTTDPVTGKKTLKVKEGCALTIERDGVELGVYDEGNLTAGVIATVVNGTPSTYIKGEYIVIGNQSATTVINGKADISSVTAVDAKIDNLTSGRSTAGSLVSNSVSAGTLKVSGKAHHNSNLTIDGVTYNIVTWGS